MPINKRLQRSIKIDKSHTIKSFGRDALFGQADILHAAWGVPEEMLGKYIENQG